MRETWNVTREAARWRETKEHSGVNAYGVVPPVALGHKRHGVLSLRNTHHAIRITPLPMSETPDAADDRSLGQAAATGKDGRRLHPLTTVQQLVSSLPALGVLLLPFLTTGADPEAWGNLVPAAAYGVVALPLIVLRYLRFRYWITASEIVIRSGVFRTQHRSMPVERVQNVQIIHPFLPRLLGMAKVKVETAGSGSTAEAAASAKKAEDESAAAAEDVPAEETLYDMSLRRVVLSGAFRFSLALLALIFGGLQYAGFDDPRELAPYFEGGPLQAVAQGARASPVFAAMLTLAVVCLLGWLTGIVLNVNRYYGFRLWREKGNAGEAGRPDEVRSNGGAKLHYRRGLLTVSEGTIPLAKVQAVVLRTNPLMRAFGWFTLKVQTMGVEGSNQQTVVPFARRGEVLALAQRIRPLDVPEALEPVSRLTIRRATIRYSWALAALVAAVGFLGGWLLTGTSVFWHGAYWGLLAWPLAPVWAWLRYRCMGYALTSEGLLVQRGVLRQRTWLLPTDRQQVFYATASLFQRRLGLKTLYLDTAGASSAAAPEVIDLPAAEADHRLRQLYDRFQTHFAESE
ncbi:MAG: hypothetical protein BRD46_01240 [Bacteroidetes bacterium QS_8_68_15]|nr:MAG: hypothetical protein BRD46_01240 [Bacteroidetes bacterium QS_8_68_15]